MTEKVDFGPDQIELGLELIRLCQMRARECGVDLDDEMARQVAEAAIIALPEELGLMLDYDTTMTRSDVLAGVVGVNDIAVNGRPIDVRHLEEGSTVSVDRLLIGTPYLSQGTLVVSLEHKGAAHIGRGRVVAYVPAAVWLKAEEKQKDNHKVTVPVAIDTAFDLASLLKKLDGESIIKLPSMSRVSDVAGEVGLLVNDRQNMISARQKQIFAYLSTNWSEQTLAVVESVPVRLGAAKLSRVLSDAACWQSRSEKVVARLAQSFPALGPAAIRDAVLRAGETGGGALSAPRNRRALAATLVAMDLAAKNAKNPVLSSLSQAQNLVEKLLGGAPLIDAVKNIVGNPIAVDLAFAIQKQRQGKGGMFAATAEELGMAYGQLALAPAYATHSSSDEPSALEGVNEALILIEASKQAEIARNIENELAVL